MDKKTEQMESDLHAAQTGATAEPTTYMMEIDGAVLRHGVLWFCPPETRENDPLIAN